MSKETSQVAQEFLNQFFSLNPIQQLLTLTVAWLSSTAAPIHQSPPNINIVIDIKLGIPKDLCDIRSKCFCICKLVQGYAEIFPTVFQKYNRINTSADHYLKNSSFIIMLYTKSTGKYHLKPDHWEAFSTKLHHTHFAYLPFRLDLLKQNT